MVVEVHDIDGRLATIEHALAARGFGVEVEQEAQLQTTEHYTLYARRERAALVATDVATAAAVVPMYWSAPPLWTALHTHLESALPEYMVPATYVALDALPLTSNGKVDRKALPAPDLEVERARAYEPPMGELETMLAEVWSDVLKRDRIGRHDDFFELGGHSLLVVRIVARLRRLVSVEVTIGDLFASPTLASLAERIIDRQLEQLDADKLSDVMAIMRSAQVN
jgi:aryl carrier-like protein